MDESAAPVPMRPRKTPLRHRRRLAWALAALVAFIAFELGIRAIPPDAVQITVTPHGITGAGPTSTETVSNLATVEALRDAINTRPTSYPAWFPFNEAVPLCHGGSGERMTYRFTWHGLPVEVASGDSGNCGNWAFLALSSGGLTAPFLYGPQRG